MHRVAGLGEDDQPGAGNAALQHVLRGPGEYRVLVAPDDDRRESRRG